MRELTYKVTYVDGHVETQTFDARFLRARKLDWDGDPKVARYECVCD